MPVSRTLKLGHKTLRKVVGEDSKVEQVLKRRYMKRARGRVKAESGPGWAQKAGNGWVLIGENDSFDGERRGVALRGGCDLPSVFTAAPLIRRDIKGSLAISREQTGGTGAHASSQVVQTLNDIPPEATEELRERLGLTNAQFEPTFFGTSLQYPHVDKFGEFPRKAVVMSAATDVVRTLYRTRKHG